MELTLSFASFNAPPIGITSVVSALGRLFSTPTPKERSAILTDTPPDSTSAESAEIFAASRSELLLKRIFVPNLKQTFRTNAILAVSDDSQ